MFFQGMGNGMNGNTRQRRGNTRTEYTFNNGNVKYKVYTSGNPFQTMFNFEDLDNEDEQNEEFMDPFQEILFNSRRGSQKRRNEGRNDQVRK